jgi:hypothetical protein
MSDSNSERPTSAPTKSMNPSMTPTFRHFFSTVTSLAEVEDGTQYGVAVTLTSDGKGMAAASNDAVFVYRKQEENTGRSEPRGGDDQNGWIRMGEPSIMSQRISGSIPYELGRRQILDISRDGTIAAIASLDQVDVF